MDEIQEKIQKITPERRRKSDVQFATGTLKPTRTESSLSQLFALLLFLFTVMPGIVYAKGFWETTISVFFFPYSYYLTVSNLMQLWNLFPIIK